MLDFLLSEITDPIVKENFLRLSSFLKGQTILEGQWEFYQVEFDSAVTNFKFKHNLSFVPVDIIILSKVGDQNVYFRSENFTRTHVDITTSGPCRIRFLAGRYESKAKSNKEFDFSPISGGGGGGPDPTMVSSVSPEISVVESPADNFVLTFNGNLAKTAALKKVFVAGENISALKLVYVDISDGKIYQASNNMTFAKALVVGIATNGALTGGNVTVQLAGVLQDASWSWASNSLLFCSSTGSLTSSSPVAPGYRIKIAKALTSDSILVNVEEPILLT